MRPAAFSRTAEGAFGGNAITDPVSFNSSPLTATLLEGDVSPAVRRRFVRNVKKAQRALDRLEKRTLRAAVATLETARRNLLVALRDASDFGQWRLPQMIGIVEDEIARLNGELSKAILGGAEESIALGVSRVGSAAQSVGVNLAGVPLGTGGDTLSIAQQIIPEMIQAETQGVIRAIGTQLRLGFAGGMTRAQIVDEVSQTVTKALRFGTVRKRAEVIARTEINRVHNAAHDETMQRLGASNVKVRKMWISSGDGRVRAAHQQLNGVTVDADAKFPYPDLPQDRWPRYPLDPILPAEDSINCRCTIIEQFEVLDGAEEQIAEEARA